MTSIYTRLTLGFNTIVIRTATYGAWNNVLCDNIFSYATNFTMYYGTDLNGKFECNTATYLLGHPDVKPSDIVMLNGTEVQLQDLIALDVFISHKATWLTGLIVEPIECVEFDMDDIPF